MTGQAGAGADSGFTVAEILSVMRGRLLCDIGGVYRLCDFMTGESLMTHQLPRASRECEGSLKEQFPDLADIDVWGPTINGQEDVDAWLTALEPQYGTHRDVRPLAAEEHTSIDPLVEMRMMRPDMPIIAIRVDGEQP